MRILFDIGHPAHVHYFKNLIELLKKNGNQILIQNWSFDTLLFEKKPD